MILAGDIGGTSTRLGLFEYDATRQMVCIEQRQYNSQQAASFDSLLTQFLQDTKIHINDIRAACFGIAGPIKKYADGAEYVAMTNIPHWPVIEANHLQQILFGKPVKLINDMVAICCGVELLNDEDFYVLNSGTPQPGNRAIIAAGTGLGEAMLYWDRIKYHPAPSEGGHTDFAPRNRLEIELLNYLWQKTSCVSYEQIISGNGLIAIYEFLRDQGYYPEAPTFRMRLDSIRPTSNIEEDQRPALISAAGINQQDQLCVEALNLFVALYGAEAGNLALKYLAFNGMYIGGGIAIKIIDKLSDGTFMRAFIAKEGMFSQLNAAIPVKAILNQKVGLFGAAFHAAQAIN